MKSEQGPKILLIGKYPPMEGGVSSKTFWLYEKLKEIPFNIQVITSDIANYSEINYKKADGTHYISSKDIPWHIPDSKLYFDRLLSKTTDLLEEFNPDIIETNYLWPYCSVAYHLSLNLKKPLIIRHAGSDIQKFYKDVEFADIIKKYFDQAKLIVTNDTCKTIVSKFTKGIKIRLIERYVPNPNFFNPVHKEKKYDILFSGKINYYWKLKGLKSLLKLIKSDNLHALFIIDGNYVEELCSFIDKYKLRNNIELMNFVHPSVMPQILNQCKSSWCWEEQGSIQDFSNIITESLYCGIPCFVNKQTSNEYELNKLNKLHPELLINLDPLIVDSLKPLIKDDVDIESNLKRKVKKELFNQYINQNINVYQSVLSKVI